MRVQASGTSLRVCEECEATWVDDKKVSVLGFVDFGDYMKSVGLQPLWSELVAAELVQFLQKPQT